MMFSAHIALLIYYEVNKLTNKKHTYLRLFIKFPLDAYYEQYFFQTIFLASSYTMFNKLVRCTLIWAPKLIFLGTSKCRLQQLPIIGQKKVSSPPPTVVVARSVA